MTVFDQSSSATPQADSPAISGTHSSAAVVIPAFNRERFIGTAVESALAQTLPADEIIVVDDGSTDRTAEIVERYPPPVRLIRIENNGAGPSRPRNVGIKSAHSEYITLLDSDDRLEPTVVERHQELFKLQPGIGLICNNFATIRLKHGEFHGKTFNEATVVQALPKECIGVSTYRIRSEVAHDAYCTGNFVKTSSASFPRATWEAVGGFDETLEVSEDYDFFMKIIAGHDVVYIDEPLVLLVFHDDNISANLGRKFKAALYTCHIRVLQREYAETTSILRRNVLRVNIRNRLLGLARGYREARKYRDSTRTYLNCLAWGGSPWFVLKGFCKIPVCCLRDLFTKDRALVDFRDKSREA
jgi:glycosyltransferase involved in cell wall biosynthesis